MLEALHRSVIAPARERLDALGIGAGILAALTLSFGIAAAVAVALHAYVPGLALFVLSRAAALIGYPEVSKLSTFDLVVYAALAFGFALAEPERALAASFLMFGLVLLAVSRLAFASKNPPSPRASLAAVAVVFVAVALACIRPDYFNLVAYIGGLVCFPVAGMFAASAIVRA